MSSFWDSNSLEEVRGHIMGMTPLPPLQNAYNMLKWEESRKQLTQNVDLSITPATESSAMVAKGGQLSLRGRKI